MNAISKLTTAAAAGTLAACATTGAAGPEGDPPTRAPEGTCDTELVEGLVGNDATAETGRRLLDLSGAKTLRWVPPRTAVTMDFRPDRLTVSYDDDMMITKISCG